HRVRHGAVWTRKRPGADEHRHSYTQTTSTPTAPARTPRPRRPGHRASLAPHDGRITSTASAVTDRRSQSRCGAGQKVLTRLRRTPNRRAGAKFVTSDFAGW